MPHPLSCKCVLQGHLYRRASPSPDHVLQGRLYRRASRPSSGGPLPPPYPPGSPTPAPSATSVPSSAHTRPSGPSSPRARSCLTHRRGPLTRGRPGGRDCPASATECRWGWCASGGVRGIGCIGYMWGVGCVGGQCFSSWTSRAMPHACGVILGGGALQGGIITSCAENKLSCLGNTILCAGVPV